jgi:hypothetical protein
MFYSGGHGRHFNHFLSARLMAESGRLHLAPTNVRLGRKTRQLTGPKCKLSADIVLWCHDTQHNDTQPSDIQHNHTQHNDI